MIAQDPTKHPGSIIRINIDGSIPKDNPKFEGKSDWLPEIYQIGIRNPQGLTLSPFDKKIYMSNHGARGGDWFGETKKGENYGWKILGWGGTNYSGIPIGPKWKPGFTKAIHYWVPSIATSAITIYKGDEFKEWNGNALITSLKDKSLRKLIFKNTSSIKEEIIFKAVELALQEKQKINIIFSPCASSFDQFKNFEDRGTFFKKTVKKSVKIEK